MAERGARVLTPEQAAQASALLDAIRENLELFDSVLFSPRRSRALDAAVALAELLDQAELVDVAHAEPGGARGEIASAIRDGLAEVARALRGRRD
jgi:broad specificity phosphatase PhoE